MNKLKKLSSEQKAYLAGFLDGDGSINAQIIRRNDYILKFQIRVSITFFQKTTRYWFLMQLHNLLGMGTLRQRSDGVSEYAIVGISNVANLLKILLPYLKLKKSRAKHLTNIIQCMPNVKNNPQLFLKLCEQVDHFEVLNDSKKREITVQTVRSELGL